MRDRGRNRAEEDGGSGDWALSYGDMMTLLLTFFILIVSFSTTELIKFRQAMGSLKGSMGVLMEDEGNSVIRNELAASMAIMDSEAMMKMLQEIEDQVFEMEAQNVMGIEISEDGVNFRLENEILFELGSATLKPGIDKILGRIGRIIKLFSCTVRVEGHTDDQPIHTVLYPSNWELSSARAVSVIRYFVNEMRIDPNRFIAVGCGEHRPLLPNIEEANRKKNRRVEIFLNWEELKIDMEI